MLRLVVETLDGVVGNALASIPGITEWVLFSSALLHLRHSTNARVSESGTGAGSKKCGCVLTYMSLSRDNTKALDGSSKQPYRNIDGIFESLRITIRDCSRKV